MKLLLRTIAAVSALALVAAMAAPPFSAAAPGSLGLQLGAEAGFAIAFGGLIVDQANLTNLYRGFKAAFQNGLAMAPADWQRIATVVPSSTREEEYGWIGKIPGVREWVGDRVVQNIATHGYSIKNKDHELTVGVDRNDIEDDNLGIYGPLFIEMGNSQAAHPNEQVFGLLKAGFATPCYDGQNFFDTDHPVLDANGNVTTVANTDGGAGTPWFLMVTRRALKPLIRQQRKAPDFVALTKPDDPNVFHQRKFVYGTHERSNVGFGFWQFAWGSKQPLNKANYKTARQAIESFKGDYGRPLGLMADLLVVPPSLEGEALELLNAERDAAGATNVYRNTAELMKSPWLA